MDFNRDILPLKNVLYRVALRITLNKEEAEDIVQDILLRLWERRNKLSTIENLEAFALKSVRNLALDRINLMHNKTTIPLDIDQHDHPDSRPLQTETIIRNEQTASIQEAINHLPEKQRTAIQLRDIEGKTYKEIAEMMGITEADVKVNIYRGRESLKKNCRML